MYALHSYEIDAYAVETQMKEEFLEVVQDFFPNL